MNDVLRETLVERERISGRDLPHEIFHIGTSHTRERRMPDEIGYEPAGVFTPDLRIDVLADYLGAGGVLVFSTETAFDWFFVRLLRPLIVKLGPHSELLGSVLLILSGGTRIFAWQDGAYRLISSEARRESPSGFDMLVGLSKEPPLPGMPALDPGGIAYIADSRARNRIDHAMASRVGIVIDVGDAMLAAAGTPISSLHRGYHLTMDAIVAATAALHESGLAVPPPSQPEVGDTVSWTFEQPDFPPGRRLRVRVAGSGFVHAGVAGPNGAWDPVFNVPLVPLPQGGYEAVLPSGVNVLTCFWTEAPWTHDRPGHWEGGRGGAVLSFLRGRGTPCHKVHSCRTMSRFAGSTVTARPNSDLRGSWPPRTTN